MRIQQKNFQYYPEIVPKKVTPDIPDMGTPHAICKGQLQAIRSDNIQPFYKQPFVQWLLEEEKRIINAA
jgi:hypothetical protein